MFVQIRRLLSDLAFLVNNNICTHLYHATTLAVSVQNYWIKKVILTFYDAITRLRNCFNILRRWYQVQIAISVVSQVPTLLFHCGPKHWLQKLINKGKCNLNIQEVDFNQLQVCSTLNTITIQQTLI